MFCWLQQRQSWFHHGRSRQSRWSPDGGGSPSGRGSPQSSYSWELKQNHYHVLLWIVSILVDWSKCIHCRISWNKSTQSHFITLFELNIWYHTDLQPVKVQFPPSGPFLCLLQSLPVDVWGVRLWQGELHHVREWALLQLVAVQRQELLELTAHVTVLKQEKRYTYHFK